MKSVRTSFVRLVSIAYHGSKNTRADTHCICLWRPGIFISGTRETTFTLARVYD